MALVKIVCPKCGKRHPVLKMDNTHVALTRGAKLYANLTVLDSEDYHTVTGEVIENKQYPGIFGLRNEGDVPWIITYESGKTKTLKKGETTGIDFNMKIEFGKGIKGITE